VTRRVIYHHGHGRRPPMVRERPARARAALGDTWPGRDFESVHAAREVSAAGTWQAADDGTFRRVAACGQADVVDLSMPVRLVTDQPARSAG
ncbi:MAG: hypothetical protein R3B82_22000, partial [Sandaracinaceae bacterium]